MKLLYIIIIMTFLALPLAHSLGACSDTNNIDIGDIACEGLTQVMLNACSGNVTLVSLNTTLQQNLTTTQLTGNRLNFTLDVPQGSYSLTACDNSTATVIVGEFQDFYSRTTYLYFFTFLLGTGFITYGYWNRRFQWFLGMIGGIVFMVLALVMFSNGIPDLTNDFLVNGMVAVLAGIGLYYTVAEPLNEYIRRDESGVSS